MVNFRTYSEMFSSEVKVVFWAVLFGIQFWRAACLQTRDMRAPSVSSGYALSSGGAWVGTGGLRRTGLCSKT